MKLSNLVLTTLALVMSAGCVHEPQTLAKDPAEKAQSEAINNQAASRIDAQKFVEIEFTPKRADLSQSAKDSISSLMTQASQDGKTIDAIYVLSWSDREYPSKGEKRLSKRQVDLANHRNQNIQDFAKSLQSVDVKKYNMAKRPAELSQLFNTTDTKLKDSMVAAGLPTTEDNHFAGKASHAVLIVKTKE